MTTSDDQRLQQDKVKYYSHLNAANSTNYFQVGMLLTPSSGYQSAARDQFTRGNGWESILPISD